MSIIWHITTHNDWAASQAAGEHRSASLATEGFIHCSTAVQIERVANKFFRGQGGLALLCIETERVKSEVRFEAPINPQTRQPEPDVNELFPHIYGPLNPDAVLKVVDFPPNADGSFRLPEEVR